MAAMRLYEPQELHDALEILDCTKTEITTDTATYWRAANGKLFSIPEPDNYSGRHSDSVYFHLTGLALANKEVK